MLRVRNSVFRFILNSNPSHFKQGMKFGSGSGQQVTAGIIIIGDEILKAQVKDTNSHFMCKLLYDCGVKVKKISVITDDVDWIRQEILDFSKTFSHVITSGGIGPTHDDVTYEGLAKAFNQNLKYNPTLVDIIKTHFNTPDTSPALKMALIPEKATLKFGVNPKSGEKLRYPCITLQNVYAFPGSPVFFELLFGSMCKELFSTDKTFVKDELHINAREESFADALTQVSKEFPHVAFGSYPENNRYYKVRVTIESDCQDTTMKAKDKFCSLVPNDVLIKYDNKPEDDFILKYKTFVQSYPNPELFDRTLAVLRKNLQNPSKVLLYFDGSMESAVLLHLSHIARSTLQKDDVPLQTICFRDQDFNSHVEEFISETVKRYKSAVIFLQTPKNIEQVKSQLPKGIEILLLPTGRNRKINILEDLGDFNSMTVDFPILDWTNNDITNFAKSLCLPCWTDYFRSTNQTNKTQT